ncbi:hypothetical protein TRFO_16855 [Tritrichomonas foetus]|uniref:Dynein heavy chain linker domain-containing protein n=1 Tax=Tritrichomonas foetus TaxID=1144522 RepID=A0A1J4KP85_9EUKA|nr:hypothetical protein TRFO_16855 [Tritrichomonas foetus]|eukprot:OHT13103.1 hypothetical protein TRFO_16855 [Tritrichomonas foetus]
MVQIIENKYKIKRNGKFDPLKSNDEMRSHQKRFQEALKRLDREVHTKASLGLYSHNKTSQGTKNLLPRVQSTSDLTETLKIQPPSSPTMKKDRTPRFKQNKNDEEIEIIRQPQPPELYKSANPRKLSAMLKIPRDSPLTAHPQEVGPVLLWKDRNILDYSKLEKELSNKTLRLHQLVTTSFDTKIDASQTLPIDFFDCRNEEPFEETKIRNQEQNFVAHGSTKMRYEDEIEWVPCTILGFNPQSLTFYIEVDNKFSAFDYTKMMRKEVSRFNLRFDNENLKLLEERYNLAYDLRSTFEQNFRTIVFLDAINFPENIMKFMKPEFKEKLPDDTIIEIIRTQKMQIIRGSLQLEKNSQMLSLINKLNININAFSPSPTKKYFSIPTSFSKSLNKIINYPAFISILGFMKLIRSIHLICQDSLERFTHFYHDFFNNQLLTIEEWETKKIIFYNQQKQFLFDLIDEIVQQINKKIGYILDETNGNEKLKSFVHIKERPNLQFFVTENTLFNRLKQIISVILKQYALDLLQTNQTFFLSLIDYEYPPIKFTEVSEKDFTTISYQPSEDSVTWKKPKITVDLNPNIDIAKDIILSFYNITKSVLSELIDPFAVLFEKSDAKNTSLIKHTKFEPFLLANDLISFTPKILHFSNTEFDEYHNDLTSLFMNSFNFHFNKCFFIFPEVIRITNSIRDFFTRNTLVSPDNANDILTNLESQSSFFQKHFPQFINIGIYQISFLQFKNEIIEIIKNYRINSLQSISNDLLIILDKLHNDYTELSMKLKISVQSPEQWNSLQDILDSVLQIREQLEKDADYINILYNLLFTLRFGLDPNVLVRYLNIQMWPILIDMELGQAIALSSKMKDYYLKSNPETIHQYNTEVEKLEESIKSEKNLESRLKQQNYKLHLMQKIVRIEELNDRMQRTNYDKFDIPRVKLWSIVTLIQYSIEEWQNIPINNLDLYSIKSSIDDYLKKLRLLTRSFRKDANSLRLLISTKNDLERLSPLFKTCAQIISPKLKEIYRKKIESIIGFPNYPNMTLEELKTHAELCEKLQEIQTIYQQSKSEDKTDIELINCEKIVHNARLVFTKKKIVNIEQLIPELQDQKNVLLNIQSVDKLPPQKLDASQKLILAIQEILEFLDLLSTIQELISILSPLGKVSSLKEEADEISNISKNYNEQIKQLINNPVLIGYATKQINIINLQNIHQRIKKSHQKLIDLVSEMRTKDARLLLVPDSQIINIFTDDISVKCKILTIAFPGIKTWVISSSNILTAVDLECDDILYFTEPICMNDSIIDLLPKIELKLQNAMKTAYFEENCIGKLPIQLCFLKIMNNPDISFEPTKMSKQKSIILHMFQQTVKATSKKIEIITDEKNEVLLKAGDRTIKYGFHVSHTNSYLLSPSLYSMMHDIISSYNSNCPFLIHSHIYSVSTNLIQLFSYLTGRLCYIIHPTVSTIISRFPDIVSRFMNLDVNVCLDEVEIYTLKQMFEITMLMKSPMFCSLTANTVPSVLQSGKQYYFIPLTSIQAHLEYISPIIFPNQAKEINVLTQTLTKYIHLGIIQHNLEQSFLNGDELFNTDFIANIRMLIPHDIFESITPDIIDKVSYVDKKNKTPGKLILSTQDFVNGVEVISQQFKRNVHLMMVVGPPFSGITTCIQTSAQLNNIHCISLVFSTENWIKSLFEALKNVDDKPFVLHILLPFDKFFLAHASSLMQKSILCEDDNSFLQISSKIFIVFEMITPVLLATQIPIPVFTFSTPLVKPSELLHYWMVSNKLNMEYDDREFVRAIVSNIIETSFQLHVFYTLFSTLYDDFPNFNRESLSVMIGYCIFWSKVNEFTNIDEWNEYSNTIKSCIKELNEFPLPLYDYIFVDQKQKQEESIFELCNVYKNPNTVIFDEIMISHYSEYHCGRISATNIPTPQFMHCIQQIPRLLKKDKSVMIIGKQGTGKSTISRYLSSRFQEPQYKTLYFDGCTLSETELLNQLIAVSILTIDGVIIPKENMVCITHIDPLPLNSPIYGIVLSIIKTGNAIINNKIVTFKKFLFVLCLEQFDYQLSTCCHPVSLKPYSDQDFLFIAQETISRILFKRSFTSAQVSHICSNLPQTVPFIVDMIQKYSDVRYLHFFFKIIRSVENINNTQSIDILDFFKWKMIKLLPHSSSLPFKNTQEYELAVSSNTNASDKKSYVYKIQTKDHIQFEEAVSPFVHLFLHNISINDESLSYISFVLDTVLSVNSHAMIVNDLHLDYETLTQFASSMVSAQFIVYHSEQQLTSIIKDSIISSQPIILYCRKPDTLLLSFISNGLKTNDIEKFVNCLNDSEIIEKIEYVKSNQCSFPYAHLTDGLDSDSENCDKTNTSSENNIFYPELTNSQAVTHRMKSADFSFLQLHFFRNIHMFFNVNLEEEINENDKSLLNKWNNSDKIPNTDNILLQHLFNVMIRFKDKAFVNIYHQLPKVIKRYNFIIDIVNKYINQRHIFVQQILVVINAIETSISDTSDLISSTKRQIEMDEAFLSTHIQAVRYRQSIVTDLTGELARNKVELEQINAKDAEYTAYKQKDSANTGALVDQATKKVVKAFTQEEQYKLYIQQNPSAAVRHLFNTYCILREFTPREDNDYWPEARVLLKSGRFHRTITVFDKNNIKKNVILQFDVMMNSPLIKEENFPNNSACRALASWIIAVHKHTQSTSFNSTVSQEILELMKSKTRKEDEINELEKKLKEAQDDLSKHEKSLEELKEKLKQENILLANISSYNEISNKVSQCFNYVKEDLNSFSEGEIKKGQNLRGFVLFEVIKSVVYPLFPLNVKPTIEKTLNEYMEDSAINPSFFISLKDILGNDNPLVLSILSGDRLIAVFDPNDSEYDLINSSSIPALSKFEFLITNPYSQSFKQDVESSSESGKVLIILHADTIIHDPFFASITSESVKSSIIFGKIINVNPDFRVVFFIDRPPQSLNPHIKFLSSSTVSKSKLDSILIKDQAPILLNQKFNNSEMMLQAQKENLYQSFQHLYGELQKIHSFDSSILQDVLLQSELLQNSLKLYNDSKFMLQHALDGFEWVIPISSEIAGLIEKLQNLYKISPLYLFPLSKIKEIIENINTPKAEIIEAFLQKIVSSILKNHLWGINMTKNTKLSLDRFISSKINILHYIDIVFATEFLINYEKSYNNIKLITYSIDSHSSIDIHTIQKMLISESNVIVLSFLEENIKVAFSINELICSQPQETWNEKSLLFITIDNSFELPAHVILKSNLLAIE